MLPQIIAATRQRLPCRKTTVPEETLRERLSALPPTLDFLAALSEPGVSIIAEVKRASPSRGALNLDLQPGSQAAAYAAAGAAAISVLTEEQFFRGSLADLISVREGLNGAGLPRPILRKDFIIDPYQLVEARVAGADAVLLIAAVLDDNPLRALYEQALTLGLTPLIEVHDEAELDRVLPLQPPLVGINNRNLADFTVSLETTRRLRPLIPPTCRVVSESGIHQPAQMSELAALGIDAALIGEALVTAEDPGIALKAMREAGR